MDAKREELISILTEEHLEEMSSAEIEKCQNAYKEITQPIYDEVKRFITDMLDAVYAKGAVVNENLMYKIYSDLVNTIYARLEQGE